MKIIAAGDPTQLGKLAEISDSFYSYNVDSVNEDWETIRTFQVTKFEQKEGVDAIIDNIRLLLNKITDPYFCETCKRLILLLPQIESWALNEVFSVFFLLFFLLFFFAFEARAHALL